MKGLVLNVSRGQLSLFRCFSTQEMKQVLFRSVHQGRRWGSVHSRSSEINSSSDGLPVDLYKHSDKASTNTLNHMWNLWTHTGEWEVDCHGGRPTLPRRTRRLSQSYVELVNVISTWNVLSKDNIMQLQTLYNLSRSHSGLHYDYTNLVIIVKYVLNVNCVMMQLLFVWPVQILGSKGLNASPVGG